jgi:hypothetical protein
LTLDIEPDEEKHDILNWLKHRRNVPFGFPAEFSDRLEIALANVSTQGPIQPPMYRGALNNPHAEVLLCEVVSAAIVWGWSVPNPMRSLVKDTILSSPKNDAHRDSKKPLTKSTKEKKRTIEVVLPYLQEVYKSNNFKNTTEFIRMLKKKSVESTSPFKKAESFDDAFFLRDGGKSLSHNVIQDNMKLIRI